MKTGKTRLTIEGQKFLINDKLTYSEIAGNDPRVHGLLMNSRLIQGIFDDQLDPSQFNRFHKKFDPMTNTKEFITELSSWYKYGLRAFTVGLQGGGPCFTKKSNTLKNNPYAEDGKSIDSAYLERLSLILEEADKLGMVVIVSFFYGFQTRWIKNDETVMECVKTASKWLKDTGYKNIIIELANEQNQDSFQIHPLLNTPKEMARLMEVARKESGFPVGCSLGGGDFSEEIALGSDVVIVHGNGCARQRFRNLLRLARKTCPNKPILCNEDSQALTQMEVAIEGGTSWGYYNNMTKQEPPVYWGITPGEDTFFATRLAMAVGIDCPKIPKEDMFYLQGLEKHMTANNMRWIRLASLYPEQIHCVKYYRNDEFMDTIYDDPFLLGYLRNWRQKGVDNINGLAKWKAEIHLRDGSIITKETSVEDQVNLTE